MAFTIGMKVVCVDDGITNVIGGKELTLNAIYTIRWIGEPDHPDTLFLFGNYLGLRLVEIDRGPDECNPSIVDMPFDARRFRPLISCKTDMSFTTGADPDSEKWDNRKPMPVYTFDTTEHESIMQYLRGFY